MAGATLICVTMKQSRLRDLIDPEVRNFVHQAVGGWAAVAVVVAAFFVGDATHWIAGLVLALVGLWIIAS